jgi:hypothetical protein
VSYYGSTDHSHAGSPVAAQVHQSMRARRGLIARACSVRNRRPFCTAILAAALAAAAVIAAFAVIVVPAVTAVSRAPGQFGRAYVSYFSNVGQQVQQARRVEGGGP